MRILVLLLLSAALISAPIRADACVGEARTPVVYPRASDIAATNTHVWIFLQDDWSPPKGKIMGLDKVHVTIGAEKTEPVIRRDFGSGNIRVIELIPRAPLKPRTRYDVDLSLGDEHIWSQRFATGEAPDAAPPRWSGVSKVSVKSTSARQAQFCNRCPEPGRPWIEIELERPSDDTTPETEILYAVWLPDKQGHLDDSKPATTYLEPLPRGRLVLGINDDCGGAAWPTQLATFKGPFKGILRAVDLAGHSGSPVEIKVNLD
jgi:hypothetical protein